MTPRHELRRAEAFKGLSQAEAIHLTNYQHFRNVQSADKKSLLEQSDAPFHKDFLDSIAKDSPKGCWCLQLDDRGDTALIRSLSWPGFQFFHKLNSNKFGNVYIGDGLKN